MVTVFKCESGKLKCSRAPWVWCWYYLFWRGNFFTRYLWGLVCTKGRVWASNLGRWRSSLWVVCVHSSDFAGRKFDKISVKISMVHNALWMSSKTKKNYICERWHQCGKGGNFFFWWGMSQIFPPISIDLVHLNVLMDRMRIKEHVSWILENRLIQTEGL